MANNLVGFNTQFLGFAVPEIQEAVRSIQALTATIVPLDVFSTPLNQIPQGITTVTIPVPVYPTSAYTGSGVSTFDATTSTNIQVTCGKDAKSFVGFNPVEAQNNGLQWLTETYIAPAVYALDATIMGDALGILANTATYASSSTKPATATAFSASALTNIIGELSSKNINGQRWAMTLPTYFWSGLMANLASMNNQVAAQAIQEGSPNNPFKVVVKENNLLPTANNLVGLAGNKSCMVVATSIPQVKHSNGDASVYVSPGSGLPYLLEAYYDEYQRKHIIGASCLYGVAAGVGSALRIVSS